MNRIPLYVVELVHKRAAGRCEHCGQRIAVGQVVALHHRKARKHGGKDEAINLMLVIGDHHNLHQDSIHQNPARSRDLGHIVSAYANPSDVPVQLLAAAS
jgi:hypothetical protein